MVAPERNLPPDAQAWGRYVEKRIAELSKRMGVASSAVRTATARTSGAAAAAAYAAARAEEIERVQSEVAEQVANQGDNKWEAIEPPNPKHGDRWNDARDGNVLKVRADYGMVERINYILNPTFNEGTDGWLGIGCALAQQGYSAHLSEPTDGVLTMVEETGRSVSIELPATPDDPESSDPGGSPAAVLGVLWTASAEVLLTFGAPAATATVEVIDDTDTVLSTSGEVVVNSLEATRITARPIPNTDGSLAPARVRITLVSEEPVPFEALVDDVILEAVDLGENTQQYFDGTMPGILWQGAPHASTSWWDGQPRWIEAQDEKLKEEVFTVTDDIRADLDQAAQDLADAQAWIDDTGADLEQRLTNAEGALAQAATRLQSAETALSTAFPDGAFSVEDRLADTLKNSAIEYAVGTSETVPPTSGWSTETPTRTPGTFIWFRSVLTYADDSTTTSNPALLTGNQGEPGEPGDPGEPGEPGVGITSVTPYYRTVASGSPAPSQPSGASPSGWTTTEPAYVADTVLYRSEKITYTNGDISWTPVTRIAAYEGIKQAYEAAAAAQAEADKKADLDWVLSRGTDLVTNGTGYLGDNTNFSWFEYEPTDAPTGARGSFRVDSDGVRPSTRLSDEAIPIDLSRRYLLSVYAREAGTGASRAYAGLAPYDAGGNQIIPHTYRYNAATMTTLAAPLNPGDTYADVAAITGTWMSGSFSYLGVWDWTDEFGKTWPAGTYTRDYPRISTIDGTRIHFTTAYTGAARPAGTPVSNNSAGGTYMYVAMNNTYVPDEWTRFHGFAEGVVDGSVTTASTSFPPGTAYVRLLFMPNYNAVADSSIRFANISFSDATAALAEAEAAKQAAQDAHQAAGDASLAADNALNAATHNSRNLFSYDPPTGVAPKGTMWLQRRSPTDKTIIGQWQQVGGTEPNPDGSGGTLGSNWEKQEVGSEVIANLDVGKLTADDATIQTGTLEFLTAKVADIIDLSVERLVASESAILKDAVVEALWAQVVRSRKMTTDMLLVGGSNLLPDPHFQDTELTQGRLTRSAATVQQGGTHLGTGYYYFMPNTSTANPSLDTVKKYGIPVQEGEEYRIEIPVTLTSMLSTTPRVETWTATGIRTLHSIPAADALYVGGVMRYSFTVPASAAYMAPVIYRTTPFTVQGGATVRQKVGANLIVKGGVLAENLAVVSTGTNSALLTMMPDGIRLWSPNNGSATPNMLITPEAGFRIQRADGTPVAWIDSVTGDFRTSGGVFADGVVSGSRIEGGEIEIETPAGAPVFSADGSGVEMGGEAPVRTVATHTTTSTNYTVTSNITVSAGSAYKLSLILERSTYIEEQYHRVIFRWTRANGSFVAEWSAIAGLSAHTYGNGDPMEAITTAPPNAERLSIVVQKQEPTVSDNSTRITDLTVSVMGPGRVNISGSVTASKGAFDEANVGALQVSKFITAAEGTIGPLVISPTEAGVLMRDQFEVNRLIDVELPEPFVVTGASVNDITASSWAALPTNVSITLPTLPQPMLVEIAVSAALSTPPGGDVRVSSEVWGATAIGPIDAGGWGTVAWQQNIGSGVNTVLTNGRSVKKVKLNSGVNSIRIVAYRNGSTNAVRANYPVLTITPLRWLRG